MSEDIFDSTEAIDEFKALMADPAARQAFVELRSHKREEGVRMKYEHILKAVAETPWAIRPSMLGVIVDLLAFRAEGGRLEAEEIAARIGAARRSPPPSPTGVAVIPLHGVMVPKAGLMSEVSGATSIEGFRGAFRQAMAADNVSSIVIDVDSPGGMVDQVPEMAAEIRAARTQKPIVAVANTEMASAAYWLASQASEIVVSRSSRVGSIGVLTAHEDESGQQAQRGIKTTLISAGRFKTEGNPFEPLTEEARAHVQSMVNEFYGMFVNDVAQGRRVDPEAVRSGFGEGRMVSAADAVPQGMADRGGSLEGVIGEMLSAAPPSPVISGFSFEGNRGDSITLNGARPWNLPVALPATPAPVVPPDLEGEAVVDKTEWDSNLAARQCKTADDYCSVYAGEYDYGEPGELTHWALPHHYLDCGPNASGVRDALARLPGLRNLKNRDGAQAHLDAHMREINPLASAIAPETEADIDELARMRAELATLSE